MQFNSKITAVFGTYNQFGELASTSESIIKCNILERVRDIAKRGDTPSKLSSLSQFAKDYSLKIITRHREFAPFVQFMSDQTLSFRYGDVLFDVVRIEPIFSFSGKPKYYEISLKEIDGV